MRNLMRIGGASLAACTFLGLSACSRSIWPTFSRTTKVGADGEVLQPPPSDHYGILLWIASGCSVAAVGCLIVSIILPAIPWARRAAAACIGSAIACWALYWLLDRFFVPAIIIAITGAIITGAAYLWGHRKWLEKRLNLDLDRDGHVGDPPQAAKG